MNLKHHNDSNYGRLSIGEDKQVILKRVIDSGVMRNNKFNYLIIVWIISIIFLATTRATYIVEKAMEIVNFEFTSKEAYSLTVEIVWWVRLLYFVVLTFLTFYLFKR